MIKKITFFQKAHFFLICLKQIKWDKVDPYLFENVVLKKIKRTGERMTDFLLSGDFTAKRSYPMFMNSEYKFDPFKRVGATRLVWEDAKSLQISMLDPTQIRLETMLNKLSGERSVSGEEAVKSLKDGGFVSLDARFFGMFLNNPGLIPQVWQDVDEDCFTIVFGGSQFELEDKPGEVFVFCLCRYQGDWRWTTMPLKGGFTARNPWAVLAPRAS